MPRKESESEKVMVTRRLPKELWDRLKAYVATVTPRTTDTAIMELALEEYLNKNEQKK